MKRAVFFFCILVIFLSLLTVPVLAAENQEYVFEFVPSISLYDDFNFFPDGEMAYYEGKVPEGIYNVYCWTESGWIPLGVDYISVEYSFIDDTSGDEPFYYSSCSLIVDEYNVIDVCVTDTYDSYGLTALLFLRDQVPDNLATYIKFVSVGNESFHLSNIISSDMLGGGLDQIVDLLPVVLVVIVAFVGIRKGIAFLQQFVRGS